MKGALTWEDLKGLAEDLGEQVGLPGQQNSCAAVAEVSNSSSRVESGAWRAFRRARGLNPNASQSKTDC